MSIEISYTISLNTVISINMLLSNVHGIILSCLISEVSGDCQPYGPWWHSGDMAWSQLHCSLLVIIMVRKSDQFQHFLGRNQNEGRDAKSRNISVVYNVSQVLQPIFGQLIFLALFTGSEQV